MTALEADRGRMTPRLLKALEAWAEWIEELPKDGHTTEYDLELFEAFRAYQDARPDPLPPDHLERHWVRWAVLVYKHNDPPRYYVVLGDDWCVRCTLDGNGDPISVPMRKSRLAETGWSFHPDSPVKEERRLPQDENHIVAMANELMAVFERSKNDR